MLDHFFGSYAYSPEAIARPMECKPEALNARLKLYESPSGKFRLKANRVGNTPDGRAVAAIAGDLVPLDAAKSRLAGFPAHSPTALHSEDLDVIRSVLAECAGTFCVVFWRPEQLLLATDTLGGRPLFFADLEGVLYFATSIYLLEANLTGLLTVDLGSIAASAAFYYPLGSRTTTNEIKVLRDGELLAVSEKGIQPLRYYDLSRTIVQLRDEGEELSRCKAAFQSAVADRVESGSVQHAFLSGGLDSRAVVAQIRELGHSVRAANCSPENTLDISLCREFAEFVGVDVVYCNWDDSLLRHDAGENTAALLARASSTFTGKKIFSGDGGGEVFAWLLLDQELLKNLRQQGPMATLEHMLNSKLFSNWLVSKNLIDQMREIARRDLEAEYNRLQFHSDEKLLQLFFILHDLRRHLHDYFCQLTDDAAELLLPFYDRRVLESVLCIAPPFDAHIRHAFYYKLLPLISPASVRVPWQAYPNSIPCPLPVQNVYPTQWQTVRAIQQRASGRVRRELLRRLLRDRSNSKGLRIFPSLFVLIGDWITAGRYGYLVAQGLRFSSSFSRYR